MFFILKRILGEKLLRESNNNVGWTRDHLAQPLLMAVTVRSDLTGDQTCLGFEHLQE